MSADVASGMKYLHSLNIVHGSLSTMSCFTDSRWNVKIADWEYTHVSRMQKVRDLSQVAATVTENEEVEVDTRIQYAVAPELVVRSQLRPTKPCDIYSFRFAIVAAIFA